MGIINLSGNPSVPSVTSLQVVGYGVLILVLYFICNAIYRLTVHPLAKYPGPFWQKLSDWPLIFQCSAGDRHLNLLQAHEKYGSVVRTGPNTLSFNTATALYAIHTDRNANVKRAEWYKTLDASTGGFSTQSVIDKHEHAFRRRIMSQAFSEKALRDAEKFIANNVRTLIHGIGEGAGVGEWTTARNFSDWATWYGFDFIGDLSFGSSFDLLTSDEHRYVPGVLMGTSKFLYYAGYLPFAFLLRPILGTPILSMLGSQAAKDSVKFTNLANSRLEARIALSDAAEKSGQETRKDIFHHLLSARDPETGRSFTMTQLQADSGLLIAAGSDGVALTLSGCLFYLLRNPHTYEKLVAEIRSAFDDAEDIGMPKLASLTYLTACIDETLRISPALPSAMPREVLPGGLSVDGLHIPSGIDVGVAAYCIQHNSTYYPSPWAFRPERWIVDEFTGVTAESVKTARKAFCPFSAGPMNCAGKNMAYLALRMALARLLWVYDVRARGGVATGGGRRGDMGGREREEEYQIVDFIAGYRDGPVVELRRRI